MITAVWWEKGKLRESSEHKLSADVAECLDANAARMSSQDDCNIRMSDVCGAAVLTLPNQLSKVKNFLWPLLKATEENSFFLMI